LLSPIVGREGDVDLGLNPARSPSSDNPGSSAVTSATMELRWSEAVHFPPLLNPGVDDLLLEFLLAVGALGSSPDTQEWCEGSLRTGVAARIDRGTRRRKGRGPPLGENCVLEFSPE